MGLQEMTYTHCVLFSNQAKRVHRVFKKLCRVWWILSNPVKNGDRTGEVG